MSKELPYFKFEPAEWMFGRIQRQPAEIKIVFLDLICKYWHKECNMTIEDAELDFGKTEIQTLIDNKIIDIDGDYIFIDFLDIQMTSIEATSKKNSIAGKKSAEARKRRAESNERSTDVQPNPTNKIREDKSIEDKTTLEDVFFDDFWEVYDKKIGDRGKIRKKFIKLSDKDIDLIMDYIPKYKISQPDKKYRKNPETFLNNKGWLDEIITNPNLDTHHLATMDYDKKY